MLKDHKFRQHLFLTFSGPEKLKKGKTYIYPNLSKEELIGHITAYFRVEQKDLIYPAKSYCVAIIYALLLEEYFGEDFYHTLNDPELFQNTDQYFLPYSQNKEIYDQVLLQLKEEGTFPQLNLELDQVQTTVNCFKDEFFVNFTDLKKLVQDLAFQA